MNPILAVTYSFMSAMMYDLEEVEVHSPDHSQGYEKARTLPKIVSHRRPNEYEATVYAMFEQTWASTALGFGGIGGSEMTSAYTVIVTHGRRFVVYFNGRKAYHIDDPSSAFFKDIAAQNMASVNQAGKYRREEQKK